MGVLKNPHHFLVGSAWAKSCPNEETVNVKKGEKPQTAKELNQLRQRLKRTRRMGQGRTRGDRIDEEKFQAWKKRTLFAVRRVLFASIVVEKKVDPESSSAPNKLQSVVPFHAWVEDTENGGGGIEHYKKRPTFTSDLHGTGEWGAFHDFRERK